MTSPTAPETAAREAAVPPVALRAAGRKKQRGRETAMDMFRSIAVVMILVAAMWFFGQPPHSDAKHLRVVDPSADVAAFTAAVPGVPVPAALATTWRPTSSTYADSGLRIGYVTPENQYAEYQAAKADAVTFVSDATGRGTRVGPVQIGGTSWQEYRDADEHTSLVRTEGATTVVVGGLRETASLGELTALAGSLR